MGEFDELAKQAFAVVTDVMGVNAVWRSSSGKEITGKVLFKNPTEPVQIGDTERYEYRPNECTAEYYADTFPDLKRSVDAGGEEYLIIGEETYFISEITTKSDGRTIVAHLSPHKESN